MPCYLVCTLLFPGCGIISLFLLLNKLGQAKWCAVSCNQWPENFPETDDTLMQALIEVTLSIIWLHSSWRPKPPAHLTDFYLRYFCNSVNNRLKFCFDYKFKFKSNCHFFTYKQDVPASWTKIENSKGYEWMYKIWND